MNRRSREIMRQDAQRRLVRQAMEDALFAPTPDPLSDAAKIAAAPRDAFVNTCIARPIGAVSPRDVRVSERWQTSFGTPRVPAHTVGIAPGADPADGPSVRIIHADGTSEIRPVVRRTSGTRQTRRTSQAAQEHRFSAADMAPVQDYGSGE